MNDRKVTQRTITKKDELTLKDAITIFTKNWKWFLLSVFLFVSVGVLYILVKNPVYYVDSSVLLKEDRSKSGASSALSMLSGIPGLGSLGSMMGGSNNVDNEMGILTTRMMLKRAINELDLNIIYKTKDGLKTVDMYPEVPYFITVDSAQMDTIRNTIHLKIKPIKNDQYKISGKQKKKKFKAVISEFPVVIKETSIDIKIDKNPAFDLKKNQQVEISILNPNVMAYVLGKRLSIKAAKKTTIMQLGLETENVKKTKDLLNSLIAIYNKEAENDRKIEIDFTAAFVEERLVLIAAELESVEKDIERYKKENNLTDIKSEAELFLKQMGETEAKRVETQIQINMIQYIEDYIQNEKNKDKMIPAVGLTDPGLQAIILKYNELLIERNTLESTSSSNNPTLQMLNNQLVSMRQNILANIRNVRGSLNVMYQDLQNQDKVMNNRVRNIPRQEREYIDIARQREIKQALYLFLLQEREKTTMSLMSTTPKAKTIDVPMPGIEPVAPKAKVVLGLMMILGLACPFAFFYLKKQLKPKIDSKEELEQMCLAEIIGEIGQSKLQERIVVKKDSMSPEFESFRLLRANILSKTKGIDKKVIIITSTIAGEGKTFIGANLALSMALTGKKVLLADLDIRRPQLATYLNLTKLKGITEYLSDGNLSPEDLIQKSGIHPNLEIVQAGAVPLNPDELLMEDGLDELFKYYRTKFDYIIVDTAPVGIVSDTFLLDRIADITLYVSRIGFAHKDSIKNINTIIEKDSLRNLYVVANGVNLGKKNGGYGYGYGYK